MAQEHYDDDEYLYDVDDILYMLFPNAENEQDLEYELDTIDNW